MMMRKMLRGVALLPALLALTGVVAAQDRGVPPQRLTTTETPRVTEIFFCDTGTTECRANNSKFELQKARDLYVYATWPNVAGDHVQTVEFYLPNGSLYLKKDTPFRVRRGVPRARFVPGSSVPEQFLTSSRGVPAVITALPVAGTFITQRNLTGTWTVRVLLDGNPVASGQFTLVGPSDIKNPAP